MRGELFYRLLCVICSEKCVEETKSFITSVVVGKDVVPRYYGILYHSDVSLAALRVTVEGSPSTLFVAPNEKKAFCGDKRQFLTKSDKSSVNGDCV